MQNVKTLVVLAGLSLSATAFAGNPDTTSDSGRAYAAELQADASRRASNLAGSGLTLADAGDTNLKLGGFAQFRYIMNFRDNPPNSEFSSAHDSGFTNGFEATRTRLEATGNIMSKSLSYKVDANFDRNGSASLKDAWGMWDFGNGWKAKWGQFKLPLLREELVSDTNQLAIDRSIVNSLFTQDRSQGIAAYYEQDQWRVAGAFSDGAMSLNTPYTSAAEADWAFTVRGEYKWGDDWKRFNDFSSWRGQPGAGLLGAALHYQHNGNTANSSLSAAKVDIIRYTADFTYEGNGWNVYAAFVGNHNDPGKNSFGVSGKTLDDFGFLLQGGYFVTDKIELFARYDGVFPDKDWGDGVDDSFHTITVGANYYVFDNSNAFKLSADIQYWPEKTSKSAIVGGAIDNGVNALRPDTKGDQFAIRFQAQLVF